MSMDKIKTTEDIGRLIREKRKNDGLTQTDLAGLCGVGKRFISELENGKPTIQIMKVLQVLACVGLEVKISLKGRFEETQ
jgi:HTH-type transcriptional regulator / antitoxin HipB